MHLNETPTMRLLLTITSVFSLFCSIQAQQTKALRKEFSFTTDNDAFLLKVKDAYYTNGFFIAYRIVDTNSLRKKIHAFELGQMIFTPLSRKAETVSEIDRPYAGYLFARYTKTQASKNDALLQWHASIGVVGSASLAKELQDSYHKLFRYKRFEGWRYQVRNALGIDLGFSYSTTIFNFNNRVKIIPSFQANLGSTFTNTKAGAIICLGSFESNNSSILFNSRVSNGKIGPKKKMELFVYTYPSITVQVYNATLEGGLFNKGTGAVLAKPETLLFEQRYGICFAEERFSTRFEITQQSKETASQIRSQKYASIQFAYRMF